MSDDPAVELPFEGVFEVVEFDADTVTIIAQRLFDRDKQQLEVPRHHVKENGLDLKPGSFGLMSLHESGEGRIVDDIRLTGEVGGEGMQPRF